MKQILAEGDVDITHLSP